MPFSDIKRKNPAQDHMNTKRVLSEWIPYGINFFDGCENAIVVNIGMKSLWTYKKSVVPQANNPERWY
jgi:hypothetical protein